MKVGLYIDTFYPMVDGVVKVVDNYATRLAKMCEVVVFCPSVRGYDEAEDKKYPYEIVRCKSIAPKNMDYVLPLGAIDPAYQIPMARSKVDIVHIHSPFTIGMSGVFYAKLHNTPLVATLHSQYRQDFENLMKVAPLIRAALSTVMMVFNSCDECWAVNSSIKELYQSDEYGLTAPCKVVLNATDHTPVEDPAAAAARVNSLYGIGPDETVFLFVGRINFIKNLDFIVRSLKILCDRGHRFKMIFAGQGQDEERLRGLVGSLGLEDFVVMTGLVRGRERLQDLYSRAKLFLFPSLYDANSLVQIEAACQGTPTLFLRGARTSATVEEDVNGYISDPSEEAYAGKIEQILGDPEGYARVSAAAREQLYLDWDTVVDGVYQNYKEMIGSRKTSRLLKS